MQLGDARKLDRKTQEALRHRAVLLVEKGATHMEAALVVGVHREARMALAAKPTFGQCAEALLAAKSSEWRNARHRAQWRITLETYAGPLCGTPVDQVDTPAVLGVLQHVWQTTPETASKAAWAD
jgi:hypothetical protein